ncbi:hypothetical protein NMC41_12975 [Pseudomonas aeruginosa]
MKSFPLFKTVDSLSLTPATARRLLHLLVGLFVLGLFCTCALYLWSKINNGVSCQRRLMNDAAGEMLLYFGRRQMLLERLGALVVRDSTLPKRTLDPHRQLPRYQHQWVALGEARSAWGVLLSGRDMADLDQMGAGLLYVRGDKRPVVSYLHGRFERRSMLPETVLDALVLEKTAPTRKRFGWLRRMIHYSESTYSSPYAGTMKRSGWGSSCAAATFRTRWLRVSLELMHCRMPCVTWSLVVKVRASKDSTVASVARRRSASVATVCCRSF